jgi:hypothetical protein
MGVCEYYIHNRKNESMKTIEKENAKWLLCETASDLNIVRYAELKNCIIEHSSLTAAIPDPDAWLKERHKMYNSPGGCDFAGLVTADLNFAREINTCKIGYDAYQHAYAIITLEENEQPHIYDKTLAGEKLKRMAAAGLTQGEVQEAITDFILASPELSGHSFLMILVEASKTIQGRLYGSTAMQPQE